MAWPPPVWRAARKTDERSHGPSAVGVADLARPSRWEETEPKWFARPAQMVCAASQMVCAPSPNGLRSWQNGLRAISDATDVLEEMICALVCAWFALGLRLICASRPEVPVAQRKPFSTAEVAERGSEPVALDGSRVGGRTASVALRLASSLMNRSGAGGPQTASNSRARFDAKLLENRRKRPKNVVRQ